MGERRLGAVALALAIATLGFHVRYKVRPERQDVEQASAELATMAQWNGRTAPDVEAPLLGGGGFRLSDVVGKKVVVLNFFATWCGPCRAEIPELLRFAAGAGESVLLVGIDVGETPETVAAFARDRQITYPVAVDGSRAAAEALGVASFPTTVVVGPDGRIVLYETGAITNAEVSLAGPVSAAVRRLSRGETVTKEAYLAALAAEPPPLTGRAKAIADAMPCPCGCSDAVAKCGCQTARKIISKLRDGSFGEKSDADVMRELDREFCVKG